MARETIISTLQKKEIAIPKDCPAKLKEKGAVFVTLEKNIAGKKHLRGCIGSLTAYRPLVEDLIENSINAAFYDPRFEPVIAEELENVEIEISVLTKPVQLQFSDYNDLLKKIKAPEDGIILSKEGKRSTFLPVVWEHFKTNGRYYKEGFLTELSLKAGLMPNAWKEKECKIEIYHAILIREDEFK